MKQVCSTLLAIMVTVIAPAQNAKKELDKTAIKAMCGCYEIIFKYAETFRSDTAYELREPYATRASAEWIFVDEENDDEMVIQHILVARDTIIIKHWRQDWRYENRDIYSFIKNNHWKYSRLSKEEVSGQWTQKVYQVDDGPRYEGSATWVHVDGKHYWESTADAPLPRREHTKRNDYNVMERRNRHQLTDDGWVHELDNKKIIRKDGKDSLLVMEKGYNIYRKIDASKCQAANDWWEGNKAYWRLVRAAWNDVFAEKKDLYFQSKIKDKKRWQRLFELQEKFTGDNTEAIKKEIRGTIDEYASAEKANSEQAKPGKQNKY